MVFMVFHTPQYLLMLHGIPYSLLFTHAPWNSILLSMLSCAMVFYTPYSIYSCFMVLHVP